MTTPSVDVPATTLPAPYSLSYAALPLPSVRGIYKITGRRSGESTYVHGRVTLNIVNGALNSVTVRRIGHKTVNIKRANLSHIGVGGPVTVEDQSLFDAFTR